MRMKVGNKGVKEFKGVPKKGMWAPGDYFCRCRTCNQYFVGDKRALACASCAYGGCAWVGEEVEIALKPGAKGTISDEH